MKAKLIIFLSLLSCIYATAQPISDNPKAITDTLKPASFITGTPTLYTYVGGGYTFGVNTLGDKAFAQRYNVSTSYIIEGIGLWIGAKKIVSTPDTLNVVFYYLTGPGTTSTGIVNDAPDSAKLVIKVPVEDIDTTGLTFVALPDSFIAYVDYAIGLDFSGIVDDTLGLITTEDGDALGTELSWNQWSDHTWHTILEPLNYHMDLDLGIFPITDMSSAGISRNYYIEDIKLSQNQPNPAISSTLIQYELNNRGRVSIEIYDLSGRILKTFDEGIQDAGQHNVIIDTDGFLKGTYYYSLKVENHRLTKKMTITR